MSLGMKYCLGGLTIVGLLTPIFFYFSIFGPLSEYSLARSDQAWANFGTFIGGTVGPILSALACIAVFLTYRSQQKQIDLLKQKAELDEIQKLVTSTCQQIEQLLSGHLTIGGMQLHLESVIIMARTDDDFLTDEGNEKVYYESSRVRLLLRIHELCSQLDMLEDAGGLPKVIKSYEDKFSYHVLSLNEISPISIKNIKSRYRLN